MRQPDREDWDAVVRFWSKDPTAFKKFATILREGGERLKEFEQALEQTYLESKWIPKASEQSTH